MRVNPKCLLAVCLVGVAPAAAQRLDRFAQVGKRFAFRYPAGWEYFPRADTASLVSPVFGSDEDDAELSVVFLYRTDVRDPGNTSEVVHAGAGLAARFPEKRMNRLFSFRGEELGGWAHSLELLDDGEVEGVSRVYAIPLRTGGTVLVVAAGGPKAVRHWIRDADAIAASVTSRIDEAAPDPAPRPVSRNAEMAPAAKTSPTALQPAAPAPPRAPVMSAEEEARLAAEWTARLAGKTWAGSRKSYRLDAGGNFEYHARIAIAGLEGAGHVTRDSGAWKIAVEDGSVWLHLTPSGGRPQKVPCSLRDGQVVIDQDPVRAN